MFLTDILFNSPRLRFSRAQQKAVLSWAKELGAEVPAYSNLRKTQDTLTEELGDPTQHKVTDQGSPWYLNDIGQSIAKVRCLLIAFVSFFE
ncbi:hypothetical protein PLICRDRAFT_119406 [Plicaturopsis crispa FD-325 SS-3]|uniref:Uncharacterized protein n=1 Tax=Plicaturopsis crispa FD-325 SS-3 TaxID=944288 RepID=A0A0C9SW53_PLICR|nr:hypothetical protein PLICRDRAFT_119406 [Plicaturopsis crispa FD-325 SS-3]